MHTYFTFSSICYVRKYSLDDKIVEVINNYLYLGQTIDMSCCKKIEIKSRMFFLRFVTLLNIHKMIK